MKKDKIPIISPGIGLRMDFNTKTGELTRIELDWEYFLTQPKDFQISDLEWILGEVKKDPTERKKELKQLAGKSKDARWAGLEKT